MMEIWKVTFSYETPGEHSSNRAKSVYNVIAETEEDAITKAYDSFSCTQCFSDLDLSIEGRVESNATRMAGPKIRFPDLTLQEDKDRYRVSAKISTDGASLEYIVAENKKP